MLHNYENSIPPYSFCQMYAWDMNTASSTGSTCMMVDIPSLCVHLGGWIGILSQTSGNFQPPSASIITSGASQAFITPHWLFMIFWSLQHVTCVGGLSSHNILVIWPVLYFRVWYDKHGIFALLYINYSHLFANTMLFINALKRELILKITSVFKCMSIFYINWLAVVLHM